MPGVLMYKRGGGGERENVGYVKSKKLLRGAVGGLLVRVSTILRSDYFMSRVSTFLYRVVPFCTG